MICIGLCYGSAGKIQIFVVCLLIDKKKLVNYVIGACFNAVESHAREVLNSLTSV